MSGRAMLSRQLDRRAFLGGFGFAAGAVVASTLVPLSVVHAAPAKDLPELTPMPGDPQWNGHVDDAWGHWPPYSYPIPYSAGRSPAAAAMAAADVAVDPIDQILMV
jgi:hypothetical protein